MILILFSSPTYEKEKAIQMQNPGQPLSKLTYFDCYDAIAEKCRVLKELGAKLLDTSKIADHNEIGVSMDASCDAVCQLIELSAQAAYLVGMADPSSEHAVQGVTKSAPFLEAKQAIPAACQTLLHATSKEQVSGMLFLTVNYYGWSW